MHDLSGSTAPARYYTILECKAVVECRAVFAVTLLALGNGAPDLVAAIAFVRAGQYRVAISGLLGTINLSSHLCSPHQKQIPYNLSAKALLVSNFFGEGCMECQPGSRIF